MTREKRFFRKKERKKKLMRGLVTKDCHGNACRPFVAIVPVAIEMPGSLERMLSPGW